MYLFSPPKKILNTFRNRILLRIIVRKPTVLIFEIRTLFPYVLLEVRIYELHSFC